MNKIIELYLNERTFIRVPEESEKEPNENNVIEIAEHKAAGVGDRWFYDVRYENGRIERYFEFLSVVFEKVKEDDN